MKCPDCKNDELIEIQTHVYRCRQCGETYSAGYLKGYWDGFNKVPRTFRLPPVHAVSTLQCGICGKKTAMICFDCIEHVEASRRG